LSSQNLSQTPCRSLGGYRNRHPQRPIQPLSESLALSARYLVLPQGDHDPVWTSSRDL